MGEAKARKAAKAAAQPRSWAIGSIEVVANNADCFTWSGTKQEAIDLQKRYIAATNAIGANSTSYAKRAAGYLMVYGMPRVGDKDQRPSNYGNAWTADEIEVYKAAILWLALREHISNTGQKFEDVFVGNANLVEFAGDKNGILDATMRDLRGELSADEKQFTMVAGVLGDCPLDPKKAVSLPTAELFKLAGRREPEPDNRFADEPVYVPRIPINAAEADAMCRMIIIAADATVPEMPVRTYAGYTNEELARGRPCVLVSHKD